jgi:hypothetical protein
MTAQWEQLANGRGYVVEHGRQLKTGSFSSKERAIEWFRKELDRELIFEDTPYVEERQCTT